VKLSKGTLKVQGNKLCGGIFVMDITTITDADLTNDSFKVRGFFCVEKFNFYLQNH
jgi:hypothetical protein